MAVVVVRSKVADLSNDVNGLPVEHGWFLFELDLHRHHNLDFEGRPELCQVGRHHRHRWHGVRMPLRPF